MTLTRRSGSGGGGLRVVLCCWDAGAAARLRHGDRRMLPRPATVC